jgi:RNA polymerase sigma-70 factor (ECF subfamily)
MDSQLEKKYIDDSKTDPRCFEPLYVHYYKHILNFVYKRVENLDDCREITAIVFTKALSSIKNYKHQGFPFSSWLFRIAINEITQFYRDSKKARIISIDEKGIKNIVEENGNVDPDLLASLKKALMYLEEDDLELIQLRFFEERSFEEVGEILGITGNNAKIKTYRVIDKLRTHFSKLV